MPNANFLVPIAFFLWVPLVLGLFARLHPAMAASISVVGATILLPAGFAYDLKGLPAIDRELIGTLGAFAGCALFARRRLSKVGSGYGIDLLAIAMIAGGFCTVLANPDPFVMAGKSLPGLPLWGGVSRAAGVVAIFWLPLYLGRALFRSPKDLRILLMVLAVAGTLYALPVLWEARMSPQLHNWVYGYTPASFAQAKRPTGWGWRPMAFVGHGLALAQFLALCLIASTALWRMRAKIRGFSFGYTIPWLYFVLIMCQSLAASVYATVTAPLLAFARLRWHRILLTVLLVVTFTYPALRAAEFFPTDGLVSVARMWHEGRAGSLEFRFENEDLLLDRARERIWFGWGGSGRERIYDERGKSETVSDGYWIIVMGQTGVVGYACAFGMMLLPPAVAIFALGRRRRSRDSITVLAMAWIIVLTGIDLLPNGFLTARTLFAGGALLGAVSGWKAEERGAVRRPKPAPAPSSSGAPRDPSRPKPVGGLAGGLLGRRR